MADCLLSAWFITILSLSVSPRVAASPTYLTGELNGNLSGRNYVVTGNIYVLPHDTLSIAPGSRIRFESFTVIVVRGAFLCNGTAREPVLLTSVRDSLEGKPPQPFDWNGVFGVSRSSESIGVADMPRSDIGLKKATHCSAQDESEPTGTILTSGDSVSFPNLTDFIRTLRAWRA